MADDGIISNMIKALWGNREAATAPQPVIPAPPLASYPSTEDANFARANGFGYGTAAEPYIQGNVSRVLGSDSLRDKFLAASANRPDANGNTIKNEVRFQPRSGVGEPLEDLTKV